MDVTTCEQYVLAELEAAQAANERLAQENERLEAKVELMEANLNAEPTRLERWVTESGRRALFDRCTSYAPNVTDSNGERVPFDVFCEDYIRDYNLPKWLSKAEFARCFEPEFRKAYEDAIAEEQE